MTSEADHPASQSEPTAQRALSVPIACVLIALSLLAIVAPILLVAYGPRPPATIARVPVERHKPAPSPRGLPEVEPVVMKPVTPDEARAFNASVPFVKGPIPRARAFHFIGSDLDRERALDCLATAALYEAGDDTTGERAVAQVVLNRVRHPAFPGTVCGVVFQGAERVTGCQFTFTCDGALARDWSDDAWDRARDVAQRALAGSVDDAVGTAPHYHTDWVVPYWSASLDKIAAVETHLFFRWTGWWGTPAAFAMRYSGGEPRIDALASRFDAHKSDEAREQAMAGTVDAADAAPDAVPKPVAGDPNLFLVTLDSKFDPATLPVLAKRACGDRRYCKMMAWAADARTPTSLPLSPDALASMAFSYLRDSERGFEKALWNCRIYPRAGEGQCMNRIAQRLPPDHSGFALEKVAGTQRGALPASADTPAGLAGVRRKAANPAADKAADGADKSSN